MGKTESCRILIFIFILRPFAGRGWSSRQAHEGRARRAQAQDSRRGLEEDRAERRQRREQQKGGQVDEVRGEQTNTNRIRVYQMHESISMDGVNCETVSFSASF